MRLIRNRANVIFNRDNDIPGASLDIATADLGTFPKTPVPETLRRAYYERAERELVAEGKIRPAQ